MIQIIRFQSGPGPVRLGLLCPGGVMDLTSAGINDLGLLLHGGAPVRALESLQGSGLPVIPLGQACVLAPADQQEVWAAGVTYLRSKKARMEESDFSASAYDRVYEAPRPELFFKALPSKVSGPGASVGIRRDAKWNVPEPELALVFDPRGELVGYSIGNDMSSRDIEGENLLYLPQAKTYKRSCALGPALTLGVSEAEARSWRISISIHRGGVSVFDGETSVGQIKRTFSELRDYLFSSQEFPGGVVLLTGTGIVPPDSFTLAAGDRVRIEIGPLGVLENPVEVV
ncbi:MAG: fumarylacetoacetate hydrolase [Verrucomicrobia bacterium]|nr:fumarylacetoacetate hydrolase [Verrucomicrobiota bacterium]